MNYADVANTSELFSLLNFSRAGVGLNPAVVTDEYGFINFIYAKLNIA